MNDLPLTLDDLSEMLREAGFLTRGSVIEAAARLSDSFGIGSTRYHLELNYTEDAPVELPDKLFLKVGPREWFNGVKGEVDFYASVPVDAPFPVPRCYGLHADPSTRDCWLLLEDASLEFESPATPHQSLSIPRMHAVMKSLATLHAFWWRRPELESESYSEFINNLDHTLQSVKETQREFLNQVGDTLGDQERLALETDLEPLFESYLEELNTCGIRTLEHGDLHAANVLFHRETDDVLLIDWQTRRTGTGMNDVTLVLFNSLTTKQRREHEIDLLKTYQSGLQRAGITDYSFEQCYAHYRDVMKIKVIHPAGERAKGFAKPIWRSSIDKVVAIIHDF